MLRGGLEAGSCFEVGSCLGVGILLTFDAESIESPFLYTAFINSTITL